MKLAYFDDFKLGVVKGDGVVDVSAVVQGIPHSGPGDLMNGLIARFEEFRGKLEDAAAGGKAVPLSSVRLRPPLPKPDNIACMA
ncbi:MAG: fumarylacetoacetate hydrolase, partial [Chloroflexota bacterium]